MRYFAAIIIIILGILLTCCKSYQRSVDMSVISDNVSTSAHSIYADSIKVTDSTRVIVTDSIMYVYRVVNNNRNITSHDTITIVDSVYIYSSSDTSVTAEHKPNYLPLLSGFVLTIAVCCIIFASSIIKKSN